MKSVENDIVNNMNGYENGLMKIRQNEHLL